MNKKLTHVGTIDCYNKLTCTHRSRCELSLDRTVKDEYVFNPKIDFELHKHNGKIYINCYSKKAR